MIRCATPSDTNAIARVHVTTWQHAYRGQLPELFLNSLRLSDREQMWSDLVARSAKDVYVATSQSGIVEGFVHFGDSRDSDAVQGEHGEIFAIYLLPDSARQGKGRALMSLAEGELARRGRKQVSLWVLESNSSARGFYEVMGYQADCAAKEISIGGREVVEMRYQKALRAE